MYHEFFRQNCDISRHFYNHKKCNRYRCNNCIYLTIHDIFVIKVSLNKFNDRGNLNMILIWKIISFYCIVNILFIKGRSRKYYHHIHEIRLSNICKQNFLQGRRKCFEGKCIWESVLMLHSFSRKQIWVPDMCIFSIQKEKFLHLKWCEGRVSTLIIQTSN